MTRTCIIMTVRIGWLRLQKAVRLLPNIITTTQAGGRWRGGYWGTTNEIEARDVNEQFLKNMNGTWNAGSRRTAGEAYNNGIGYTANLRMDGNDWTTLCPAPMADSAVWPDSVMGNVIGWGGIIFDTYMNDTISASSALVRVSGCPTFNHRWAGNSNGMYMLGFDYDKTGGQATTMQAVPSNCKNKDTVGSGREMDGDRVASNNDDKQWPF